MIRCYTGQLGSGKTSSMIQDVRREFASSLRQVYTNSRSLHFPEQVYLDIDHPEQLADVTTGIIVYDEMQIALSSRGFQSAPKEALQALAQLRKNGLDLYCTTQHINRLDTVLRELVSEHVQCRGFFGRWVLQTYTTVGDKKPFARKLRKITNEDYALYDSWEVLGNAVQKRIGESGALARLRRDRDAKRRGKSRPVTGDWFDAPIWLAPEQGRRIMTADARESLRYLLLKGLLSHGQTDWQERVSMEVARRNWLKCFDLSAGDVPATTTYAHPWAAGCCPCHRGEDEPEVVVKPLREFKERLDHRAFVEWIRNARKGAA